MAIPTHTIDRESQKFHSAEDDIPAVRVFLINQLVPNEFDALTLGYDTASNLTAVNYFTGGTGGTQVAALALGYSGSTLTSVAKT